MDYGDDLMNMCMEIEECSSILSLEQKMESMEKHFISVIEDLKDEITTLKGELNL